MKRIRKAVLPVAGLGTRFLPATKSVPKEMLTVVDRPVIQHVVDEAKEAGIEHFVFVTGRNKGVIEDHFDMAYELDRTLQERGKTQEFEALKKDLPGAGQTSFTRQQAPLGLGHAVWCAREIVGDEPFAVILPDMLSRGCMTQMMAAYEAHGGNIIAVEAVPEDQTHQYGIVAVGQDHGPTFEITAMVERMLDHPNIEVRLNADFREVRAEVRYGHLVYTGPIDEYYDFRFGPLPYRSLRFEPETLDREWFQPAVQVNYPNEQEFTRIVEIKHITGQTLPRTTIIREYPQDYAPGREAYYPIPAPDARALYQRYEALTDHEMNVSFVGRMATYRYYNMDQVVGMALTEFDKLEATARCPTLAPS